MNPTIKVFVVAASSAFAFGCGSAELGSVDEHPDGAQPSGVETAGSEQGVRGTLLTTVQLSADHRIDFFELAAGGTVVREEYSMDVPTEARLPGLKDSEDAAALFRALRPGQQVPSALHEADARDVVRKRAEATNELYASVGADEKADVFTEPVSTRATTCSGDVLGDGWGGQWFLDNHCASGENAFRKCWANASGYESGAFEPFHKMTWTQFEGDFNRAGSFMLQHRSCGLFSCTWDLDFWESVPPRKVLSWWSTRSKLKITSLSPCAHQGVVFNF